MKRRTLFGTVAAVALTAWPAIAIASPQHGSQLHVVKANSQTFTDPTGDSGNAPDVTNVTVSNDDKGQITFAISLPNRTSLAGSDVLLVGLDTNGNSSDGIAGADYVVGVVGPLGGLFSATGGNLSPITPTSPFSATFANGVQTISLNKADIGNPTQLSLYIASSGDGGNTIGDLAPDSGSGWTYQVTIATSSGPTGSTGPTGQTGSGGQPAVKLTAGKAQVSTAVHGKPFTASMVVTDASTGQGVSGTVTCSAKLGGKTLPGGRHSASASGTATCTWKLPASAKGKQLTGKISETYKGKSVSRSFSAKVK